MGKILFVISTLCITNLLFCFPYRLVRLTGPEENIVDIIFEIHDELDQPEPGLLRLKPAERAKQMLFTIAQRRFLKELHKLNKQKKAIGLLWELDSKTIKDKCPLDDKELADQSFLLGIGCLLWENYQPAKKRNITFIPVDNFRRIQNTFYELWRLDKTTYPESLQLPLSSIQTYFDDIKKSIDSYLAKIKPHISELQHRKLQEIYQSRIIKKIKKIEKIVNQHDKKITIEKFFKKLKQQNQHKVFKELWHNTITLQLTNIEMLMKIIASNKKHTILYGGGLHGEAVLKFLSKNFGYHKTIDIGYEHKQKTFKLLRSKKDKIEPALSVAGILLINAPTKRGIKNLLQEKSIDQFAKLFKIIREKDFIEQIQKLIPQYDNAFIDLFNLQNPDGKTLLHVAAKQGWGSAAHFIVEQPNISLDIKDNIGETPLFKAIRYEHENIIELLLEKGANPLVRNNKGKNTLDLAVDKPKLLTLLKSVVPQK